MKTSKAA